LDVVLGALSTPSRVVMSSILVASGAAVGVAYPWATPLLSLGPIGYAFYIWWTHRPESAVIQHTVASQETSGKPDLNYPEMQGDASSTTEVP
jgi:hypothetical protein